VVGTKGWEGAGPVIVGAVAEQLVRLAPCPVLAVAADWNAGEFRPTPGGPVLLALERNQATSEAVATAYSLAQTFHRTLLVLHARSAAETVAFLNPSATTLEEFGIKPSGQFPVRCIVKGRHSGRRSSRGHPAAHPCILVAGVKRSSETPGPHGTAFALLARSRVPVLCVPPQPAPAGRQPEALPPLRPDSSAVAQAARVRRRARWTGIRRIADLSSHGSGGFRSRCIWSDLQ